MGSSLHEVGIRRSYDGKIVVVIVRENLGWIFCFS